MLGQGSKEQCAGSRRCHGSWAGCVPDQLAISQQDESGQAGGNLRVD